jgi:PTH1 family peptidyl-tRNA hydrolase
MAVQAIAKRHDIAPWRRRFQGVAVEGPIGGARVLLLLPGTFMNESGRAVAEAAHFYKLGLQEIVVFHDEIDLAPAKVRVKTGGGVAGHNGLRSISAHVGNDYRRVRIGVGHPGVKEMVQHYVLSDFAKSERDWVEGLCDIIADSAGFLVKGQDASFQNKVHLAMVAKGFLADKDPPGALDSSP